MGEVAPPTPEEERAFALFARDYMIRAWSGAAWAFIVALAAWWPLDPVLFAPEAVGVMAEMRVGLIAFIVLCRVVLTRLRFLHPFTGPGLGALVAVSAMWLGWHVGRASDPTSSWNAFLLGVPLLPTLLVVGWPVRLVATMGATLASFGAFVYANPAAAGAASFAPILSFAVFMALLSTAAGEMWTRVLRQGFVHRERLIAREAELRALKEGLEERVARQTAALRALYDRLESGREEERRALSRELHDELGQELTAARLTIALARRQLEAPLLEELEHLIDRTHRSMRRILSIVRPPRLDEGLEVALRAVLQAAEVRAGLQTSLSLCDVGERLETTVFRVVQEAVTNVCRHADARRVDVSVVAEGRHVVVRVADDGVGLAATVAQPGLGLTGIRERAESVGGRMDLLGPPGLTVEVWLPA